MNDSFGRVFALLFGLAAGAFMGWIIGRTLGATAWAVACGAAAGVALMASIDSLRAARLMQWLRGSQTQPAPRDTGFWGETGYRVEKALRGREQEAASERERLREALEPVQCAALVETVRGAGYRLVASPKR